MSYLAFWSCRNFSYAAYSLSLATKDGTVISKTSFLRGDYLSLHITVNDLQGIAGSIFMLNYDASHLTALAKGINHIPMTTSAEGAITAERIRNEFKSETFSPLPGQEIHVTSSIGLTQYKPQEEMKAFVHRADQLIYQGKKNGKDRVCSEL
jgi:hypothetical protein